jgi:Fur family transcriptional regulator, peroxide stress response regulator
MSGQPLQKSSRKRDLVLQILRSSTAHPAAEWIYQKAKERMPSISRGTVYRNLKLLCHNGQSRVCAVQDGVSHYDGDMRHHYHIICTECGRIDDVPHTADQISCHQYETLTGYSIHSHQVEFYGICQECRRKQVVPQNKGIDAY